MENTRFGSGCVLDNSAFAGVMRLYSPEREVHRLFLRNYPDHREIDERSLADFLTALCVYDFIFLDSSLLGTRRNFFGPRNRCEDSSVLLPTYTVWLTG